MNTETPSRIKAPRETDVLSFMRRKKPRGSGIDYWHIRPTGGYSADCEIGKRLADEYLTFIGKYPTFGNKTLLTCIVRDMIDQAVAGAKWTGVHVGFLASVNNHAMAAAAAKAGYFANKEPDPCFAAIAAWRDAQAAVDAATGTPVARDEAAFGALCQKAQDAGYAAIETAPATPAGRRAYAEFGRDYCQIYRRLGFTLDSAIDGVPSIPEEMFAALVGEAS